jgi:hypothetical protein
MNVARRIALPEHHLALLETAPLNMTRQGRIGPQPLYQTIKGHAPSLILRSNEHALNLG